MGCLACFALARNGKSGGVRQWAGRVSQDSEIHRHSGWLIPLGFLAVVAALCGAFLLYYLRPATAPFRDNRPTAATTMVHLSVRGLKLNVPARYIESRAARGGGDQDVVPLFAALPDMRGDRKSVV